MPLVSIEGVFMGANVKKSTFDGKERSSLYIDLYQQESEDNEKTVQIKSDDVSLINDLSKNYSMGSKFKCQASVNAYKNKAYYKLQKITG
ncbi:hypothetical protein KZX50_26280 [Bacillus infantis]|uniref:hypothetical protein n=1 Tax=Bacillus infantis TaxID=324767 RepID=UPI002006B0E8|nr:hypothetical protein [Bacillus infantis]MCK6208920.1 hypothetical protein [Bacillus infantis]